MASATPPVIPNVVFVPNVRVDRGLGHFRRCLSAASSVGGDAALYLAADEIFLEGRRSFDPTEIRKLARQANVTLWEEWPESLVVKTVVLDLQACPPQAVAFARVRAKTLIGWDEGGHARHRFPYLIDSLPHHSRPAPNLRQPGLLNLPFLAAKPVRDGSIRSVIAVFGGADPAGLTPRFLRMVRRLQARGAWPYRLTVVRGPLSRFMVPAGTDVLEAPERLAERLGEWDLVVTSWGLTALEALAAATPVVILNPTSYHEKLTRWAGLPSFGVRHPRPSDFWKAVEVAPEAARWASGRILAPPLEPGAFFSSFSGSDARCPVCGSADGPVFARTTHKSYHRCPVCTMEYLSVHNLAPKQYGEAYFFEEYQRQYGKTYLEDFRAIQAMGKQRLARLESVAGSLIGKRVLDVGCAYGPFLAAVDEVGAKPYGLDIAPSAVEHVSRQLGFPARQGSILDFSWAKAFAGEPRPDVVTLWFVIEHFPHLEPLMRKLRDTLADQGWLAFSTPNGRGISRRFRTSEFWTQSPDDHFTIWSPRIARRVLARFGFEVLSIRVTGHHPERFPGVGPRGTWSYRWISFLSHLLGWGDTFEIYARKKDERR